MWKNFFIVLVYFISSNVYAHGEDQLGPNGGFIRMPGAFHTELVFDGNNQFNVFLLDMEWKNPIVEKSKVVISFGIKKSVSKIECQVKTNHFTCLLPKEIKLKNKSEIVIEATRNEQVGNPVTYIWPLKLKNKAQTNKKNEHNEHKQHH